MQKWEDELAISLREDEWQQRVFAASVGPREPALFWQLFDPEKLADEPTQGVFFPATEEEFEQLLQEWEAADAFSAQEEAGLDSTD